MKIRQKCWFNPKPEGKKKTLAHVVSLLVFKGTVWRWERRVCCAQKYERVSPKRSGWPTSFVIF